MSHYVPRSDKFGFFATYPMDWVRYMCHVPVNASYILEIYRQVRIFKNWYEL